MVNIMKKYDTSSSIVIAIVVTIATIIAIVFFAKDGRISSKEPIDISYGRVSFDSLKVNDYVVGTFDSTLGSFMTSTTRGGFEDEREYVISNASEGSKNVDSFTQVIGVRVMNKDFGKWEDVFNNFDTRNKRNGNKTVRVEGRIVRMSYTEQRYFIDAFIASGRDASVASSVLVPYVVMPVGMSTSIWGILVVILCIIGSVASWIYVARCMSNKGSDDEYTYSDGYMGRREEAYDSYYNNSYKDDDINNEQYQQSPYSYYEKQAENNNEVQVNTEWNNTYDSSFYDNIAFSGMNHGKVLGAPEQKTEPKDSNSLNNDEPKF